MVSSVDLSGWWLLMARCLVGISTSTTMVLTFWSLTSYLALSSWFCIIQLSHWAKTKWLPIYKDILKCIFLNENVWIWIIISHKFGPWSPVTNIPALVQIMAWPWPGDRSLSQPVMVSLLMHIYVNQPAILAILCSVDDGWKVYLSPGGKELICGDITCGCKLVESYFSGAPYR